MVKRSVPLALGRRRLQVIESVQAFTSPVVASVISGSGSARRPDHGSHAPPSG
jgi:hypothetical protein